MSSGSVAVRPFSERLNERSYFNQRGRARLEFAQLQTIAQTFEGKAQKSGLPKAWHARSLNLQQEHKLRLLLLFQQLQLTQSKSLRNATLAELGWRMRLAAKPEDFLKRGSEEELIQLIQTIFEKQSILVPAYNEHLKQLKQFREEILQQYRDEFKKKQKNELERIKQQKRLRQLLDALYLLNQVEIEASFEQLSNEALSFRRFEDPELRALLLRFNSKLNASLSQRKQKAVDVLSSYSRNPAQYTQGNTKKSASLQAQANAAIEILNRSDASNIHQQIEQALSSEGAKPADITNQRVVHALRSVTHASVSQDNYERVRYTLQEMIENPKWTAYGINTALCPLTYEVGVMIIRLGDEDYLREKFQAFFAEPYPESPEMQLALFFDFIVGEFEAVKQADFVGQGFDISEDTKHSIILPQFKKVANRWSQANLTEHKKQIKDVSPARALYERSASMLSECQQLLAQSKSQGDTMLSGYRDSVAQMAALLKQFDHAGNRYHHYHTKRHLPELEQLHEMMGALYEKVALPNRLLQQNQAMLKALGPYISDFATEEQQKLFMKLCRTQGRPFAGPNCVYGLKQAFEAIKQLHHDIAEPAELHARAMRLYALLPTKHKQSLQQTLHANGTVLNDVRVKGGHYRYKKGKASLDAVLDEISTHSLHEILDNVIAELSESNRQEIQAQQEAIELQQEVDRFAQEVRVQLEHELTTTTDKASKIAEVFRALPLNEANTPFDVQLQSFSNPHQFALLKHLFGLMANPLAIYEQLYLRTNSRLDDSYHAEPLSLQLLDQSAQYEALVGLLTDVWNQLVVGKTDQQQGLDYLLSLLAPNLLSATPANLIGNASGFGSEYIPKLEQLLLHFYQQSHMTSQSLNQLVNSLEASEREQFAKRLQYLQARQSEQRKSLLYAVNDKLRRQSTPSLDELLHPKSMQSPTKHKAQYEVIEDEYIAADKHKRRQKKGAWYFIGDWIVSFVLALGQASLSAYGLFRAFTKWNPLANLILSLVGFTSTLVTNFILFRGETQEVLKQALIDMCLLSDFKTPTGKLFGFGILSFSIGMSFVMGVIIFAAAMANLAAMGPFALIFAVPISLVTFVGFIGLMFINIKNLVLSVCELLESTFPEIAEYGWGLTGIIAGATLGLIRLAGLVHERGLRNIIKGGLLSLWDMLANPVRINCTEDNPHGEPDPNATWFRKVLKHLENFICFAIKYSLYALGIAFFVYSSFAMIAAWNIEMTSMLTPLIAPFSAFLAKMLVGASLAVITTAVTAAMNATVFISAWIISFSVNTAFNFIAFGKYTTNIAGFMTESILRPIIQLVTDTSNRVAKIKQGWQEVKDWCSDFSARWQKNPWRTTSAVLSTAWFKGAAKFFIFFNAAGAMAIVLKNVKTFNFIAMFNVVASFFASVSCNNNAMSAMEDGQMPVKIPLQKYREKLSGKRVVSPVQFMLKASNDSRRPEDSPRRVMRDTRGQAWFDEPPVRAESDRFRSRRRPAEAQNPRYIPSAFSGDDGRLSTCRR